MSAPYHIYAQKAIDQIPRLLSLLDRNPFSPTYGCFHRDYWLYKTSDFPDAVRQFGVHALALVYKRDFPGNIYKGQTKIRDWTIAGLHFWANIQHRDGSFDEFYPYERGWVGPTAFTTFASIEAYNLLKDELPAQTAEQLCSAIRRASYFIAGGESEEDHLANHHAMACLAVWKAYELLGDPELKSAFQRLWQGFKSYHDTNEGWSREYDGVDPGYLSATVSFLGKIYQNNGNPDILDVLRQSIEFFSYFAYPNGFYSGSLGSRNTMHFYPHGFEILAGEVPLAGAVAEKMLQSLQEKKLVPPEIMSDRYVFYRVPEFLQAYLDYSPRPAELPPLPYERKPFTRFFRKAGIYLANTTKYYIIANLSKGGVIKVFDCRNGRLLMNDCGVIGQLDDGRVVTSQWVDPDFRRRQDDNSWEISGNLHIVPSNKLFSPLKNIVFRGVLMGLGWIPRFSHWLKGSIRKALMLGRRPVGVQFRRQFSFDMNTIFLSDELHLQDDIRFKSISVGDEFFVRYVPQSRFFQIQELDAQGSTLEPQQVENLNRQKHMTISRSISGAKQKKWEFTNCAPASSNAENSPDQLWEGVYNVDYYYDRRRKQQLVYRLQRRTDEVKAAIRRHGDGQLRVVVDVGTADGLMLENLKQQFGSIAYLGVDLSFDLLRVHPIDGVFKCQGDALRMPVKSGVVDVVIATAAIEHVPDAGMMLKECARMLRPGGMMVITTPDPLMERIASAVGLLKETGHHFTYNLRQLQKIAQDAGLASLESRKFMFSPIGFPAEKTIERILGPVGLKLIMANQLLVLQRS